MMALETSIKGGRQALIAAEVLFMEAMVSTLRDVRSKTIRYRSRSKSLRFVYDHDGIPCLGGSCMVSDPAPTCSHRTDESHGAIR